MTLVDTKIVLDVISHDPVWAEWSGHQLALRAALGIRLINEPIYAELSARIDHQQHLESTLSGLELQLARSPVSALFLAGKAFKAYRLSGGTRTGVLPDFFIGAHAQVSHMPILTRDVRRYRTYFPDVALISPDL